MIAGPSAPGVGPVVAGDATGVTRAATAPWPETPLEADLAVLGPDELGRLETFGRERDRAGFAASHALLRRLLGELLGCAPADVPLVALRGRPPFVARGGISAGGAAAPGGPSCSLSRRGGLVVAAVAPGGRIGVDAERIEETVAVADLAAIARDILAAPAPEVGAIAHGRDASARGIFARRWALTEAVLKALGTGFATDPREVRLDLEPLRLLGAPGLSAGEAARFRLATFDAGGGHLVALATDGAALPDALVQAG